MTASTRRAFVASLLLPAWTASLPAARAQAAASGKPNRLVLQVSDGDAAKWSLALGNVYNVQNDLGAETVEAEIVVYGPGIGMIRKGSPVADRVASAVRNGVRVVACENTMTAQHLTKADMLPGIGYVPAGVVEIMKRQQQGWAYVRP